MLLSEFSVPPYFALDTALGLNAASSRHVQAQQGRSSHKKSMGDQIKGRATGLTAPGGVLQGRSRREPPTCSSGRISRRGNKQQGAESPPPPKGLVIGTNGEMVDTGRQTLLAPGWNGRAHLCQTQMDRLHKVVDLLHSLAQVGVPTMISSFQRSGGFSKLHTTFHVDPSTASWPRVGNWNLSLTGSLLCPFLRGVYNNTEALTSFMKCFTVAYARNTPYPSSHLRCTGLEIQSCRVHQHHPHSRGRNSATTRRS